MGIGFALLLTVHLGVPRSNRFSKHQLTYAKYSTHNNAVKPSNSGYPYG